MVANAFCLKVFLQQFHEWLACKGRKKPRGAHHGLPRRRIMGSALKLSFWQLRRKGNGKSGPDSIFYCLASCKMREQSILKYMYESMAQCRLSVTPPSLNDDVNQNHIE
jgi:hypothetical protein